MMTNLPAYVFIDDSTLSRQDVPNVLRSEMEVGPQKTRPIQSIPLYNLGANISVCLEDFDLFRAWYRNDLKSGAYWFLMNDPFNGVKRRFRFAAYDLTWQKTGNLMSASVTLEAYDGL